MNIYPIVGPHIFFWEHIIFENMENDINYIIIGGRSVRWICGVEREKIIFTGTAKKNSRNRLVPIWKKYVIKSL